MNYVHTCSFCGWSRDAETAVVLPPGCPDCGCPVDSETLADSERRAAAADAATPPAPFALTPLVRALAWLFAVCFACAAARVGYLVAGPAGAVTALGIVGFLLLPLVPERIGDARPRTP